VNIKLLKNFMLEFLPDDAQLILNEVLNSVEEKPMMVLNNGLIWTHFQYFKNDNKALAIAAANGVVLGFALAYSAHKHPEVEVELAEYLRVCGLRKGENVVNFLQKKGSQV
jgi:hypothetical protein